MPGLYGITSNANVSVYNTTGLYNLSNANITLGNTSVSNTPGLYQGLGNPTILTNAQVLYNLLSESGNVQFALTAGNTLVQAFTASIGTPAGTYGSGLTVPVITTSADGRVTDITQVSITGYVGQYSNANVAAYLPVYSGNVNASYFTGNGYFLTGLPASSVTLTGDVTGAGNTGTPFATTLSSTGVVGGTYGSSIFVPQITVDAKGRVTTIANVLVSPGGYANSNVAAYLPIYGGKVDATEVSNAGSVNVGSQGVVQLQYDPSGVYNLYDIANGSWLYLDNTGLIFQSNVNGTTKSVYVDNAANLTVDGKMVTTLGVFWANGEIFGGTFSNANVAAYLPYYTGSIDNSSTVANINANVAQINANVAAANAAIATLQTQTYSNANVAAYLPINSANVAGQYFLGNGAYLTGIAVESTYSNANVIAYMPFYTGTLANSSTIISIQSNVGAYQIWANANIASTASNVSVLQTNAATQATQINSINANVTAANANITSLQTNVSILQGNVANINANITSINSSLVAANLQIANLVLNSGVGVYSPNIANVDTNWLLFQSSSAASFVYTLSATSNALAFSAYQVTNLTTLNNYPISGNVSAVEYVSGLDYYNFTITVDRSSYPWLTYAGTTSLPHDNAAYSGWFANSIVNAYVGNAATQQTQINSFNANVTAANAQIAINTANITTLFANAAAQATAINSINANVTAANVNITTLFSNAATQATAINSTNANVTAANARIQTISANLGAYQTWANVAFASNYGNANVAAYLPTYTGTLDNSSTIVTINSNVASTNSNVRLLNAYIDQDNNAINRLFSNVYTYYSNIGSVGTNFPTLFSVTGPYINYQIAFDSNSVVYTSAWNITNLIATTSSSPTLVAGNVSAVTPLGGTAYKATFSIDTRIYNTFTGFFSLPLYANAVIDGYQYVSTSYGNANVAAYLPTDPTIQAIQANVTAANSSIQTISANLGAYQTWANGRITTLDANLGTATTNITTLFANAATQATAINAINANITAANSAIATLDANVGAFETYTNLTFQTFSANSGAYQVWANGAISALDANITAANVNIADLYTKVYSNANVAAYMPLYLPGYSGDLGNIVVQGNLTVNGTTTSINYNEYVAGLLVANSTTPSTSTTSGALLVKGGAGVAGNVNAGAFYSDIYNFANGVSIITSATGTYSNANVAAYLPVYGGNILLGNIVNDGHHWQYNADGSISFANATAVTTAAGKFWYDTTTGSWNAGMGGGLVTQQIGEELYRYGKASSTINDSPLQLVYKTGTVGASGVITFAPAIAGIIDGDQILGCATEPIATNAFGRITTYGLVRGIATDGSAYGETWADNDDIYYNPVTGGLTKTLPTAPGLKLLIGTVVNAGGGGSGSFSVKLGVATYLSRLSDVQLSSNTGGQLLSYSSADSYWKNTSLTAGTGVAITTYTNGNITIAGTYSNANVQAYLPTDPTITSIEANVTAANAAIATLSANVGAFETYANIEFGAINANLGAFQTYSNTRIGTLEANVGAFETYANATFSTSTYSNVNVAAYLPTDPTIQGINANVTAANAAIATIDANVGAYETWANGYFASTSSLSSYTPLSTFNVLDANVGAYETWANGYFASTSSLSSYTPLSVFNTLDANVGAFETYANTTFATTSALSNYTLLTTFNVLDANVGAYEIWANGRITTLDGNLGTLTTRVDTLDANLGAFELYANATFGTSSYGNANVAAYLPTDPTITAIQANVTAANASIQTLSANLGAFETYANATFGSSSYGNTQVAAYLPLDSTIIGINANVAAANARIQTLDANVGAYETWANATFATTSALSNYTLLSTFNTLDANVGAYETWANATFYKSGSSITVANVVTTNGVFWANGTAYGGGGGTYGNTQVAAYLPIYAGNISAANMYATSANVTGLVYFGSSYKETVYNFGTTSGTITANLANGTIQTITLNGNMTINTNNFTNMGPGQSVTLVIVQDATGGRTLTSNVLFAGNAKTLTNAASAIDTLSVFYDGTRYLGALVKGYV